LGFASSPPQSDVVCARKAVCFRFVTQFVKIATVAELDEWSQAHVDRSEPAGPGQTANEPHQSTNGSNRSTAFAAIRAYRW
jgi:hypothetical protein